MKLHNVSCANQNLAHFDLRQVKVGCRECALFDAVRFAAYRHHPGDSWAQWRAYVLGIAEKLAATLADRLPCASVRKTGVSVARYCWRHRDSVIHIKPWLRDTRPEKQAERGRKGGLVSGRKRTEAAQPRWAIIRSLREAGHTAVQAAAAVGCSVRHVFRVLAGSDVKPITGRVETPRIPSDSLPNPP